MPDVNVLVHAHRADERVHAPYRDQLALHSKCRLLAPRRDHWNRVAELCRATGASGKLVADAQQAAVAMAEHLVLDPK